MYDRDTKNIESSVTPSLRFTFDKVHDEGVLVTLVFAGKTLFVN